MARVNLNFGLKGARSATIAFNSISQAKGAAYQLAHVLGLKADFSCIKLQRCQRVCVEDQKAFVELVKEGKDHAPAN